MQSHYWTHFRIEDQGDQYRIHVTTEPLPCPPKRRNTPGNRWNEERDFIRGDFAAYLGNLRYHRTQILLNSLNETIDREWLGRRPLSGIEHAYGDGLFTWVPPEHRTDWLTRAYRDLPKGDLVLRDPVRMVNALLCSAPVRDAEARVDFFD
jgi:hypothetical protein